MNYLKTKLLYKETSRNHASHAQSRWFENVHKMQKAKVTFSDYKFFHFCVSFHKCFHYFDQKNKLAKK